MSTSQSGPLAAPPNRNDPPTPKELADGFVLYALGDKVTEGKPFADHFLQVIGAGEVGLTPLDPHECYVYDFKDRLRSVPGAVVLEPAKIICLFAAAVARLNAPAKVTNVDAPTPMANGGKRYRVLFSRVVFPHLLNGGSNRDLEQARASAQQMAESVGLTIEDAPEGAAGEPEGDAK